MKKLSAILSIILLGLLIGCGGGGSGDVKEDIEVTLSPLVVGVDINDTQQFAANILKPNNKGVTWSLTGAGCSGATCGVLSNPTPWNVTYTAPPTVPSPATVLLHATSVDDTNKSATATITVTVPLVAVVVAPPTVSLNGGGSQSFTATVSNATDQTVVWSLTGVGTLDPSGKYTAPGVVPVQQTATVTATSNADPSKSGSAIVTLIPISVTVSPSAVTVPISTTQQFTAKVNGTSNQLVTWNVSGVGCSGSGCGAIDSSGLYTAPGSVPLPATVTVQATASADPTKSGTATVTLTDNANSKLNGHYAFSFQGFDFTWEMTVTIGSFTADGNGNLTNGLRDVNSVSGAPIKQQAFTGTYQLHGDNRGTMTFTSLAGSPSFRFSINSSADKGYMVEIDSTGTHGGGLLRKQTTSDFLLSKLNGDYAFGFQGDGVTGERNTAVGRFHANGAGVVSSGVLDTNQVANTSFTGSLAMSSTTGAANGRGTMTITIPGQASVNAGFFMVDDDEMFFVIEDQIGLDVPLINGGVLRQSGVPFASTALNGTAAFYWNDQSQTPGTTSALIGRFTANGSSSLIGEFALSDGGTPTPLQTFTATYSISTNGRALFDSPTLGRVVFYLVDQNRAVLIHGTAAGMLEPQVLPAGGLQLTDLPGHYFNRNAEMVLNNTGAFSATLNLDGTGSWTGIADVSWASGSITDQPNVGQLVLTSGTTGRITNTMAGGAAHHVMYAVTTDKLLILDIDDSSANQGVLWQTTVFWEK